MIGLFYSYFIDSRLHQTRIISSTPTIESAQKLKRYKMYKSHANNQISMESLPCNENDNDRNAMIPHIRVIS